MEVVRIREGREACEKIISERDNESSAVYSAKIPFGYVTPNAQN